LNIPEAAIVAPVLRVSAPCVKFTVNPFGFIVAPLKKKKLSATAKLTSDKRVTFPFAPTYISFVTANDPGPDKVEVESKLKTAGVITPLFIIAGPLKVSFLLPFCE